MACWFLGCPFVYFDLGLSDEAKPKGKAKGTRDVQDYPEISPKAAVGSPGVAVFAEEHSEPEPAISLPETLAHRSSFPLLGYAKVQEAARSKGTRWWLAAACREPEGQRAILKHVERRWAKWEDEKMYGRGDFAQHPKHFSYSKKRLPRL